MQAECKQKCKRGLGFANNSLRGEKMTVEECAAMLNGRQYCNELTAHEELQAKDAGLLIVFGASDDLCELRGAIHDEAGAYNGGTVSIRGGEVILPIERDDEEVLEKYGCLAIAQERWDAALKIKAKWESEGYSWVYETDAPHATFDIMEDDDKYCRGIVLELSK